MDDSTGRMDDIDEPSGRTKAGTFLASHVEGQTAILSDVTDGEVLTLSSHPDLDAGEVIDATVEAEPPLEATWVVTDVEDRRTIAVECVDLEPTGQIKDAVEDADVGALARLERAGRGEIHGIKVRSGSAEQAAAEIADDTETVARAARLDATRVEIRTDDDVVSVRYLPE